MRFVLGVALVCFVSSLSYCAEPLEGETPQAEAIKANFAKLVSEDKEVKREALLYFGKVDKTFAAEVPLFTASLKDKRNQVRAISAFALGKIGQAAAGSIPEVEKLLADPSATVQKHARRAMERLKPFKPVPERVTPEEAARLLAENRRSSANKDEVVETAKRIVVWNTRELFKSPRIHTTKERPANGMKSFFYEGADYKGKPTWVFTYYAAPSPPPPEAAGPRWYVLTVAAARRFLPGWRIGTRRGTRRSRWTWKVTSRAGAISAYRAVIRRISPTRTPAPVVTAGLATLACLTKSSGFIMRWPM